MSKILIVDDNEILANGLGVLLKHEGHAVEVAYDSEAALKSARAFVPEVILLDLGLPHADGYEVAAQLKAQHSSALLIALTGRGGEEEEVKIRKNGFAAHLVKPAGVKEVQEILTKLGVGGQSS